MYVHTLDFEDAMPSLDNFSTLIIHCDYTKWREIADCLEVPRRTVTVISNSLQDDKLRDQKAFLMVLASWREKAPLTIQERKANWRNFRKTINFHDIVKAIEKIKQE